MLEWVKTFRNIRMGWLYFACEKDMNLGGRGGAEGKLLGVQLCLLTVHTLKSSFPAPENVAVFGDGSCCCVGVEWTSKTAWLVALSKREIWTQTRGMSWEYWSCAATAKTYQRLGKAWNRSFPRTFRGSLAMPASWSWTLGLQNCGTIHFSCLSHLVCGILLQQPTKLVCKFI